MLFIGLSGGIGSGKSTVSRRLRELGAVIVDADVIAREVVEQGSVGLASIVDAFGDSVLQPDGSLDRTALGAKVFGDAENRRVLEGITHPLIRDRTIELVLAAGPDEIVIHDVPLLVEKNMGADYHLVVIVDAAPDVRLQRLIRDRGMTTAEAQSRIDAQADDAQRYAAADVLLDNNADPESLLAQVDSLWHQRLVPYADNLLSARPAPPAEGQSLTNDEAVQITRRVVARIERVVGDHATDIARIVSTSAAGHPTQVAIDIHVGVARLSDADRPEFITALSDKGFPRIPVAGIDDERRHASCDPGQPVRLRVGQRGRDGASRTQD